MCCKDSKKISGAIFDIDGTLLDSMGIWEEVGMRYLQSLGILPEANLSEILFSMSMEEGANYLKEHYHLSKEAEQIKEDILKIIADFYYDEVTLKPGVKTLLELFEKRKIPMVLATSGDKQLAMAALKRLEIDGYFSKLLTCTEFKTSKREPLIYEKAIEFFNVPASGVIVFEDVLYALKVAKKLGCITVGVEDVTSQSDRAEIIEVADYYVRDFKELKAVMEEIKGIDL